MNLTSNPKLYLLWTAARIGFAVWMVVEGIGVVNALKAAMGA